METRARERGIGVALILAVVTSSVSIACTSSETAVATAPTSQDRCQINVSNSTASFTASGGSGTVTVATARDCTWTIATDANWVAISGARDGQGEASVAYTVAPNPVPAARAGAITVGNNRIQLSQAAAPCSYSLSRTGDSIAAGGGRLTFDVATLSGCAWSAVSDSGWITIASGQTGNANGTVSLTVAANTGAARVGHVTVAGQAYTVSQAASTDTATPTPTPPPTPSPPPPPPPPPSGTQVHIEGTAFVLGGSCPNITFLVKFQRIVTDGNTEYDKKNDCSDLQTGTNVDVDGIDTGDVVRATKIKIDRSGMDVQGYEHED
jgi:Putative binding domain, N-terminal/Viral BACON domain